MHVIIGGLEVKKILFHEVFIDKFLSSRDDSKKKNCKEVFISTI